MVTIETTTISLSNTDNKAFYVNDSESYPLEKNLFLFKEGLINKINATSLEQLIKLGSDISKEILINNIKVLTINDDRELIIGVIALYNDL